MKSRTLFWDVIPVENNKYKNHGKNRVLLRISFSRKLTTMSRFGSSRCIVVLRLNLDECWKHCHGNICSNISLGQSLYNILSFTGHYYSKVYFCPESFQCTNVDAYVKFIDKLPLIDNPQIFGMHENANIAFQVGILFNKVTRLT